MITLVTTTRNRALCFSLCERWMQKQTLKWDQWLVVNDGSERYDYTLDQQVIRRSPSKDILPSICENWLAALPHIRGDRVFCIEDDDYYHSEALATLNSMLDSCDLAGISHDVYFKLPTRRFQRMHNAQHASLAASAWKSSLLPMVESACKVYQSIYIDLYLWVECDKPWPCKKELKAQPLGNGQMLHVGMKNMPGGPGLGIGHKSPNSGSTDPAFAVLRQWVGPEAVNVYKAVWEEHFSG